MTRSSRKRQDILKAAIREFKANGYENTSMDQIAASAQVSKRTVYNHFAGKELLFDGIIEQMLTMLKSAVSVEYRKDIDLAAQLAEFAQQEIALLASPEFTDLARVCLAEAFHNPQRIDNALKQVQNREGDFGSWLRAAVQDGRLQIADIDFAAQQFFGLIKSFCFWPQLIQAVAFPDAERQRQIVNSSVNMFLKQYQMP